jgi:hypothetical protein
MEIKYIGLLLLDYAVSIGLYYYSVRFLNSSIKAFDKSADIEFINKIRNIILIISSIIAITGIAGSLYSVYYPDAYLDRTRDYSGYARTIGALLRPAYCALLASGLTFFTGVLLRILQRKLGSAMNENGMRVEKIREKVHLYLVISFPMLTLWLMSPKIGIILISIYMSYLYFMKAEL